MEGNIGNYKGVMLCNRPNQQPLQKDKPKVFVSRVDPKDPLGFNKAPRLIESRPRRKQKPILARHKQWLQRIQDFRAQASKEQEENSQKNKEKSEKFTRKMQIERQLMQQQKNPEDRAKILTMKNEEELKPKWALTEGQNEQTEEREVDDLLNFFENLDYQEYVDDLEFRIAMEIVKQKVSKKLIENVIKDKPVPQNKPMKYSQQPELEIKEETKKQYRGVAKAIADKILKENPHLRQVHSNASIRKMLEGHIIKSIAGHPSFSVLQEKVELGNLVE